MCCKFDIFRDLKSSTLIKIVHNKNEMRLFFSDCTVASGPGFILSLHLFVRMLGFHGDTHGLHQQP